MSSETTGEEILENVSAQVASTSAAPTPNSESVSSTPGAGLETGDTRSTVDKMRDGAVHLGAAAKGSVELEREDRQWQQLVYRRGNGVRGTQFGTFIRVYNE